MDYLMNVLPLDTTHTNRIVSILDIIETESVKQAQVIKITPRGVFVRVDNKIIPTLVEWNAIHTIYKYDGTIYTTKENEIYGKSKWQEI